jgi:hypothetical protein
MDNPKCCISATWVTVADMLIESYKWRFNEYTKVKLSQQFCTNPLALSKSWIKLVLLYD